MISQLLNLELNQCMAPLVEGAEPCLELSRAHARDNWGTASCDREAREFFHETDPALAFDPWTTPSSEARYMSDDGQLKVA